MRRALFLVCLMLLMSMPIVEGEADVDGEVFTWEGQATSVELIGEWDWNNTTIMTESNGIWSASISLENGMYCYKIIVDGDYIFDPTNPYRGYCEGIENSVITISDEIQLIHWIDGNFLKVSGASTSPNVDYNFSLEGDFWALNTSSLPDGKHTIELQSGDSPISLAIFWIGEQADFVWEDALIYMVMTDRFVNGNSSNDGATTGAATEADWQGGDLEGVTQMIESGYFTELGINALWISPFNTNPAGSYIAGDGEHMVSGYHGYWPTQPRQVDPRFGGEVALDEMIEAAHDAGIRVMADFVVNHVHEDHIYYQEHPEWFNEGCLCGTDQCDWTERRLDCLFMDYMPDVDWTNREASEQIISDALWWIERFDLDGMRVDAVKHVDDLAITNLATRINERFEATGNDFHLKGETAMGWSGHTLEENAEQYGTINRYIGPNGLDGQADFVLYHAVIDNVLASGNMDYQHLDYWTNRSQDQYVEGAVMNPYIGSHDTPRFISRAEDSGTQWNQWAEQDRPATPTAEAYDKARQALGWLLTTPGAPIMYMGDESGQPGGADPDNRRMMDFNLTDQESDLLNFTSELAQIRLENIALRRGTYSTFHVSEDLLVFEMTYGNDSNMIVLNRGYVDQLEIPYDEVIFGDATLFDDALAISANSVTVLRHSTPEPEPELIIGLNSLFIGHSFFRPFADRMPSHAAQAGITGHSQSIIFSGGATGAPQALWENANKRDQIQAILDVGDIELFGMTYHGDYPTSEGYENWIEYALAQNPDTRFFLALPWGTDPGDTSAETYASIWHAGHSTVWHDLIDTLRALYPNVDISCIPYGQSALELRLLFSADNLSDVDFLTSDTGEAIYSDDFGHADDILKELGALVWLIAIYDVDMNTYVYNPGYIADLKGIAQSIMDAHDAAHPEPEPEPEPLPMDYWAHTELGRPGTLNVTLEAQSMDPNASVTIEYRVRHDLVIDDEPHMTDLGGDDILMLSGQSTFNQTFEVEIDNGAGSYCVRIYLRLPDGDWIRPSQNHPGALSCIGVSESHWDNMTEPEPEPEPEPEDTTKTAEETGNMQMVRNILAIVALLALILFIQMNRRSGDNH